MGAIPILVGDGGEGESILLHTIGRAVWGSGNGTSRRPFSRRVGLGGNAASNGSVGG